MDIKEQISIMDKNSKATPLADEAAQQADEAAPPKERGGQKGPEPTRYGDWEKDGICSDF